MEIGEEAKVRSWKYPLLREKTPFWLPWIELYPPEAGKNIRQYRPIKHGTDMSGGVPASPSTP